METIRTEAERLVGRTIAEKYRLERLLGIGGHGAVFEARHVWTQRRVALKVLLGTAAAVSDSAERFLREARAAASVEHAGIVEVLDMGRDEALGGLYLVVEFLDGEDLKARLQAEGHLSPYDAVALLLPVMRGLAAAHAAGVVHRDVKPANVFLARLADGSTAAKLIDFGVSRLAARDARPSLTLTGSPIGTPEYMSPEQARGDAEVDGRSDIWAVAVVLYECLCGARPFQGASYNALLFRIALEAPTSLSTRVPSLPEWLVRAVERGLEKLPDDRYASMEDFVTALDSRLRELPRERPPVVRVVPENSSAPTPVPEQGPSDTLDLGDSLRLAASRAADSSQSLAAEAISTHLQPLDQPPAALDVLGDEVDLAVARTRARGLTLGVVVLLAVALGSTAIALKLQPTIPRPTVQTTGLADAGAAFAPTYVTDAAPSFDALEPRPTIERVSGSLVRSVAEPARPRVRGCVGDGFFGQVAVTFTLRPDGRVRRVEVEGALAETTRGRCVAETLAALSFPPLRGRASATVRWRYVFAPPRDQPSTGGR